MKPILSVVLLLFFSANFVFSQNLKDTIYMEKMAGETMFFQGYKVLELKEMEEILRTNKRSSRLLKSVEISKSLGLVLSSTGGYLVGLPLGIAMRGENPVWEVAVVGAGFIGLAVPLYKRADRKFN